MQGQGRNDWLAKDRVTASIAQKDSSQTKPAQVSMQGCKYSKSHCPHWQGYSRGGGLQNKVLGSVLTSRPPTNKLAKAACKGKHNKAINKYNANVQSNSALETVTAVVRARRQVASLSLPALLTPWCDSMPPSFLAHPPTAAHGLAKT